jgi:hypothetical protein
MIKKIVIFLLPPWTLAGRFVVVGEFLSWWIRCRADLGARSERCGLRESARSRAAPGVHGDVALRC